MFQSNFSSISPNKYEWKHDDVFIILQCDYQTEVTCVVQKYSNKSAVLATAATPHYFHPIILAEPVIMSIYAKSVKY